jgi:membrane dipeptidase
MSYSSWKDVPADVLKRVHHENFVFDFSPLGEPFIMTPDFTAAMHRDLAAGAPIPQILRAMLDARIHELETQPAVRDEVRRVWRESGVNGVQVTLGGLALSPSDWDSTLRDAAYWLRRVRAGGDMAICDNAADLRSAQAAGKVGVLLGMQDITQMGKDVWKLEMLRDFGTRVIQLTFNIRNYLGDGCTEREQSGLSKFGIDVVHRMNKLGIIVDVSHSGYNTTLDAIRHSRRPVAITHSSCQVVAAHPRAKSDEQLRSLRDADGYIGMLCCPFFIKPQGGAVLADFLDHIEHAVTIVGVDKVGIGTDWGGWSPDYPEEIKALAQAKLASHGFAKGELDFGDIIPEFDAWTSWSCITAGLVARGFSEPEVAGLIGGNWLSFMDRHDAA